MKGRMLILMGLLFSIATLNFAMETNLSAEVVSINEKGGEIKKEAETANPGDLIEYVFSLKNTGENSEYQLNPSIPIPSNMVLIPESISPGEFQVSVDGENYINYPVYDLEGKVVETSAYKGVKWSIEEMKPNEETQVQLRVRINS